MIRVKRKSTPLGNWRAKVHPSEPAEGHCGSLNSNRGRDEYRQGWWEVDVTTGVPQYKENGGRQEGRLFVLALLVV